MGNAHPTARVEIASARRATQETTMKTSDLKSLCKHMTQVNGIWIERDDNAHLQTQQPFGSHKGMSLMWAGCLADAFGEKQGW
jgi:uncharacterized damage-inducible protein DinB